MPKCDFNKVAPVNLLHIFRTPFCRNAPVGGCFRNSQLVRKFTENLIFFRCLILIVFQIWFGRTVSLIFHMY